MHGVRHSRHALISRGSANTHLTFWSCLAAQTNTVALSTTNTDLGVSDIRCDLLHWYNPLHCIHLLPRTRTCCLHAGAHRTGTSGYQCIPACTQRWIHMSYVLTWLGRCTSLPSLSARRRLCTNCIDVCAIPSSDTRFGACSVPAAKIGTFTTPIVPK